MKKEAVARASVHRHIRNTGNHRGGGQLLIEILSELFAAHSAGCLEGKSGSVWTFGKIELAPLCRARSINPHKVIESDSSTNLTLGWDIAVARRLVVRDPGIRHKLSSNN